MKSFLGRKCEYTLHTLCSKWGRETACDWNKQLPSGHPHYHHGSGWRLVQTKSQTLIQCQEWGCSDIRVTPGSSCSWKYATNSVLYVLLLQTKALMLHSTDATTTGQEAQQLWKPTSLQRDSACLTRCTVCGTCQSLMTVTALWWQPYDKQCIMVSLSRR